MTRTMCSYETYINMANIPSIPYIINARATVGKGTPAPLSVTGGAIYPAGSARSAISQEQSVLCAHAHHRSEFDSTLPCSSSIIPEKPRWENTSDFRELLPGWGFFFKTPAWTLMAVERAGRGKNVPKLFCHACFDLNAEAIVPIRCAIDQGSLRPAGARP
jgi:hypothetical protein